MTATMGKRCKQKRRYDDELGAKMALASISRRDNGDRIPIRAYRCPICHGWHITGQHKGERE